MFILENVPLASLSTMRLGGNARFMSEVANRTDVEQLFAWAKERQLPIVMIGTGSNIIWGDGGFPGLVLVNKVLGFDVFEEDDENIYITMGAGENWDDAVKRTVKLGYSGIEQLSLIPGTVGATPVQNVGAYGREIADVLTTLEVYDTKKEMFVTMRASDCNLGYRTSRFKSGDRSRFLIMSITVRLTKKPPEPPFYGAIEKYFGEHGITEITPHSIRKAVIDIRSNKLPDPAKVNNVGSFFHNPIIDSRDVYMLVNQYDSIPHWQLENGKTKLSAAWLIEQAGFKDYHDAETGMATWPTQSLVFVNESATSTADLLKFKAMIVEKVQQKFGVVLTQEPEIIGEQ